MIGILDVTESNDLMITCKSGITIRMAVADIREAGRATQGVRLIRLDDSDEIAAVARLDEQEEDELLEAAEGEAGAEPSADTDNAENGEAPAAEENNAENTEA